MDKKVLGVCISLDRLQQLIRAEHDANHLKALIGEKHDSYGTFSREEIKMLYTLYCDVKEED